MVNEADQFLVDSSKMAQESAFAYGPGDFRRISECIIEKLKEMKNISEFSQIFSIPKGQITAKVIEETDELSIVIDGTKMKTKKNKAEKKTEVQILGEAQHSYDNILIPYNASADSSSNRQVLVDMTDVCELDDKGKKKTSKAAAEKEEMSKASMKPAKQTSKPPKKLPVNATGSSKLTVCLCQW